MATLSNLINTYYAFKIDNVSFLVAAGKHPNPVWKSYFEDAPGLFPDPIGGDGPGRIFTFNSEPPKPGTIVIKVLTPFVIPHRFDSQEKSFVYVQDGHGYNKVDINTVT